MPNELYIYTTPRQATVTLRLDDAAVIFGRGPLTANGRDDAHILQLPPETTSQGSVLTITAPGHVPFGPHRGLLLIAPDGPAQFLLDDVHLTRVPEPPPPGTWPTDPLSIVQQVYNRGGHELKTKDGCGRFTEAACEALREHHSKRWGHIKKIAPQNKWNDHAVDALMLAAGEGAGIYDLIFNSVHPDATPSLNYKGPPVPELWYYPPARPAVP